MKTVLYQDIHGYNDTVAPSLLKDTEAQMLINAVSDSGGVVTRPGSAALNTASVADRIERSIEWLMNGESRILFTTRTGKKLFRLNADGTKTELATLASGDISTFQIQNILYVADGTSLYELGTFDYTTESGTITVATGKVVKNTPASSGGGVLGHFYKAKSDRTSCNTATTNYGDTTYWEDVTDTVGILSSVFRPVVAKNLATAQKVKLVINYNASAAANVTITLNGTSTTIAVAAGDTATVVATKIRAGTFTGYTTSGSGSTVYFTATASGTRMEPEYDAGTTTAYGTISVATVGAIDDNRFGEFIKCKTFLQHPLSKRIFATGNPTNPVALYYTDYNDPTHVPVDGLLYPTTAEKEGIALVLLGEAILISYTNSWWYFSGVNPKADAVWKMLNLPYGAVGKDAVTMTPFSFTFLSHTGLYEVNAAILNQEVLLVQNSQVITPLAQGKVENTIKAIANGSKVKVVFHDNRVYIAYSATAGADCDQVLVLDSDVGGFFQYEGWQVNDWCPRTDGSLLFASQNYLLQTGVGTHDIDVLTGQPQAIRYYLKTKDYDLGLTMAQKFLQFLYLLFKQDDTLTNSTAKLTLLANYHDVVYDALPLTESFIWGRPWGLVWGKSSSSLMELMAQPRFKARTFSMILESTTLDNPIGFYGIGFQAKLLRPAGRMIQTGKELIE